MAKLTSPRGCDHQAQVLDNYLAENGFSRIAHPELERIQEAFSLLQERFSIGVSLTNSSEESSSKTENASVGEGAESAEAGITAQAARRKVAPLVRIYEVGTFAMDVPSPGDPFRFIAFGTVSVDVYEELVWECVQRLPGYRSLETKVYEVNKMDGKLRLEILFQNQVFEFLYFHSEVLARSVQQPWTMPGKIQREDHSVEAYQAVEEVEESTVKRSLFANSPSHRRAYYTIRAWAILKGLWNGSHSKDIIHALGNTLANESLDFYATIATVFGDGVLPSRSHLQSQNLNQDWSGRLKALRNTSICERINAKSCLLVNTIVGGCSNTAAGKWISLVERRLPKLSRLLQAVSPKQNQSDSGALITLWPHRLTFDSESGVSDSQAGVYESCFLIGLSFMPNPAERLIIDDVANRWMTSILKHEYTLDGRTIMSTQLLLANDERLPSLSSCPRVFPRIPLRAPNPLIDDDKEKIDETQGLSKRSRSRHSSTPNQNTARISSTQHEAESESSKLASGKFPTATQVQNRLKHDSAYKIEDYMIGYKDFDTIAEMPAENWIRETTDEAFVPESRVKYFVRYASGAKVIVWDRERRINEMFRKKAD